MGYTPSPLGVLESAAYAQDQAKILHFKELRGKIFRIKNLAPQRIAPADFFVRRGNYI
jgi:hypothetical protein